MFRFSLASLRIHSYWCAPFRLLLPYAPLTPRPPSAASASNRHPTTRWHSTFCIQMSNIYGSVDQCTVSLQPPSYSLTRPLFAQIPSPTDRSSQIPSISRVKPGDRGPCTAQPNTMPPSSFSGPCRESRIRTICFSKLGLAATCNAIRAPVWRPGLAADMA